MSDDKLELSRRKILGATGAVGAAGAAAGLGTSALFSDQEEFGNNLIQAGTTNLIAEAGIVSVSDGLANNGTIEIVDATEDSDGNDDTLTVDGTPDPALGLTVGDMKPGDSFIIRVTVEVEDNPMYVAATAANTDDSEGVNTEPENSTQSGGPNPDVQDGSGTGNGSDAVGDGTGDDAGDLDNELLVTFGYDGTQIGTPGNVDRTLDDTDGSGNPQITPDPGLGFDGSSSATATSFLDTLQGGGLTYRKQASGTADPPGGHGNGLAIRIGGDASASNVDREQVTHFIKFELPINVGNEVQGDSFSFDLGFAAEQVRNNSTFTGATITFAAPAGTITAGGPP
jgi:predicted ribosomally synthesized peptide with SipW-like signal peptide